MTDYDKLRSGRIPSQSFIRALDLCGFKLTIEEIKSLVERYIHVPKSKETYMNMYTYYDIYMYMYVVYTFRYKSTKDPNYIEYSRFSDDVECIFTVKELEKMPTVEVNKRRFTYILYMYL